MKKHRVTATALLAYCTLILALVTIVVLTAWTIYPYQPLTVHRVSLVSKSVKQGDTLAMRVSYTKTQDITGIGVRWFVDGITYSTPPLEGRLPSGVNVTVLRDVPIPLTLPPGVYHLHNVISFEMNPIRTVDYSYDTPTFTVLPANVHPDAGQDAAQ